MTLSWNENKETPIKLLLYNKQIQKLSIKKQINNSNLMHDKEFEFKSKNVKIYKIKCNVSQLIKELSSFKYYYLLPIYSHPSNINWDYYNAVEYQNNIIKPDTYTNILTYNISWEIFTNNKWSSDASILLSSRKAIFNNIFDDTRYIFNLISLQEVSFKDQSSCNIIYDWDDINLFEYYPSVESMNKIKTRYNIIINKIKRSHNNCVASGMIILYDKNRFQIEVLNNIPLVFNFNYQKKNGRPIQMVFFTCNLIYINVHAPHSQDYPSNLEESIRQYITKYINSLNKPYGSYVINQIFNKIRTYRVIINGDFNQDITKVPLHYNIFNNNNEYINNKNRNTCCVGRRTRRKKKAPP